MNNVMQLAQVFNSMKNGNPAAVFQQFAQQSPQGQAILQAMNSGSPLTSIVDAELQKNGMTREQAMEQLKQAGFNF